MTDAAERQRGRGGRPAERLPVVRFRAGDAERGSDLRRRRGAARDPARGRAGRGHDADPRPGQDAELALGFLLGEAIVDAGPGRARERVPLGGGDGGVADVAAAGPGARPAAGWQRDFYATSSCGICGKASIEAVRIAAEPCRTGPRSPPTSLSALPDALRAAQRVFDRTGGLHAAGLFDAGGRAAIVARGRRAPQRRRQGRRPCRDGRPPAALRACAARLRACLVRDRAEGAARRHPDRRGGVGPVDASPSASRRSRT